MLRKIEKWFGALFLTVAICAVFGYFPDGKSALMPVTQSAIATAGPTGGAIATHKDAIHLRESADSSIPDIRRSDCCLESCLRCGSAWTDPVLHVEPVGTGKKSVRYE